MKTVLKPRGQKKSTQSVYRHRRPLRNNPYDSQARQKVQNFVAKKENKKKEKLTVCFFVYLSKKYQSSSRYGFLVTDHPSNVTDTYLNKTDYFVRNLICKLYFSFVLPYPMMLKRKKYMGPLVSGFPSSRGYNMYKNDTFT